MPAPLAPSEQIAHSTVRIEVETVDGKRGTGTGFFLSFASQGDRHVPAIVTNKHVIEGAVRGRFHLSTADADGNPTYSAHEVFPFEGREAFDAYARLYHLGLLVSRISRTAGLAYRVAGIDAICQVYKAWKGPSAFMRNFAPSLPNICALVGFLYSDVRSAHFHAGQATLDQDHMIPFHPLMTAEYVKQMEILDQGYWLTRLSFANWVAQQLLSILGPPEEQPQGAA